MLLTQIQPLEPTSFDPVALYIGSMTSLTTKVGALYFQNRYCIQCDECRPKWMGKYGRFDVEHENRIEFKN